MIPKSVVVPVHSVVEIGEASDKVDLPTGSLHHWNVHAEVVSNLIKLSILIFVDCWVKRLEKGRHMTSKLTVFNLSTPKADVILLFQSVILGAAYF